MSSEFELHLARERRARLAAERMLDVKTRELAMANAQLSRHALDLSDQIVHQRVVAAELQDENAQVKSDLKAAQERLWSSFQAIPDGFAVFDSAHRLVLANRAYLDVFDGLDDVAPGLPYADLLGLCMSEGIVNPEDLTPEAWVAMMQARWAGGEIERHTLKLWHGGFVQLNEQRAPQGDILCLAIDITETVQRQAELEEAQRRAEAASRAKSAFLANMSHEIRTPMNGVVGMAELLCDGTLDEDQRLYAETIRNSGEALLTIINDVLDYSKIEAEKLSLFPEPFDLEQALREVLLLIQPVARAKGLSALVDFDLTLPSGLIGDAGRLRQVLTNLLGNAFKFTETGHVLVRVVGEAGAPAGHQTFVVSIEDTGIGIAPDLQDHIFGEFNQAEEEKNRKFEGTGLGLAISRHLIRLMGGEIWVHSIPGEGSTFSIRLTLPLADTAAAPPVLAPRHVRKVAIVDDLAVNRLVLDRQLQALGLLVQGFASGADLLDALQAGTVTPDLVITDHEMDDMDGPALAGVLVDRLPGCPVLLLSSGAVAGLTDAERALFAACLTKPVLRADLLACLGQIDAALVDAPRPVKRRKTRSAPVRGSKPPARKPRATAKPKPPKAAAPPPEPVLAQDAAPKPLIVLAAEDNRTNQLVFRKMVKDQPIDLTFANNGVEAVASYKTLQPDLVFMDISMPEMDGMEATRTIRAYEAEAGHARVPIVAMTAHAMDGDAERIMDAGVDHVLTKPLRKAALADRIRAAIDAAG